MTDNHFSNFLHVPTFFREMDLSTMSYMSFSPTWFGDLDLSRSRRVGDLDKCNELRDQNFDESKKRTWSSLYTLHISEWGSHLKRSQLSACQPISTSGYVQ